MTCLRLLQVLLVLRSSSVQELLLWGRPSLMSPLPAPDPASQQWPNLVWKRATMGEPTGPLISRSLPPTHPAGQRGSRTHTSAHTRRDTHELPYERTIHNSAQHTPTKQMIAETLKELWQQPFSFPFPLPILNPPSPPSHTYTHTPGHGPPSLPVWSSLISQLSSLGLSQVFCQPGAPVVGVIHTLLPLAHTPCEGWGEHTHTHTLDQHTQT